MKSFTPDSIELPLYKTFTGLMALEKRETHKGVDANAYLLLMQTLHQGYCLNSFDELLFLCEKLWLKPFHTTAHAVNQAVLGYLLKQNLQLYAMELGENQQLTGTKNEKNPVDIAKPAPSAPSVQPTVLPSFVLNTSDQSLPETELYLMIADDAGDGVTAMQGQSADHLFKKENYFYNYRHLPVSPRFIEQTFRSLRYPARGLGEKTVDLNSTIEHIASQGFFSGWQFKKQDAFITRWTLLLDHEGSMIAFADLQQVMIKAAFEGSMINEGDVYYFNNCPATYLYTNDQHTRSIRFDELANGPVRNLLMVSDAGAARGWYSEERVLQTFNMLYKLRKHRIAWLNPMPAERWVNTSAEDIAQLVNMFELGNDQSDGLGNIIRSLKSKIF